MTTSVAMTTYNGKKYVIELLDSIRNQTLQPDEVIIIDDMSTDGTFDIVNEYILKNKLKRWRIYRNKKNLGWRANFREALKKCSGDVVFLCDQDDIWFPDKILSMKHIMEKHEEIQLLISNYSVLDIDREEKITIPGLNRDDGTVEKLKFHSSSLSVMRPGCTYCARGDLIKHLWDSDIITAPHDAMLWGYATIFDGLYLYNKKTIQFRRHSESASTPKQSLCRTRRIGEIMYDIEIADFFLNICKERGFVRKGCSIEKQLIFSKKRKEILERKSIIDMLLFQVKNHKYYATLRNMLSDDYVLFLKRN